MTDTEQPRRPGEWPEQYVRMAAERARWELTLGSIRAQLEEQPSPGTIRAAETRWKNAITNIANELINTRRDRTMETPAHNTQAVDQ